MQHSSDHISKQKHTEETSQNPHRNYSKEKKFMKSKESSNIENEDGDTNTTSNGKDICSPTRRGNQNWHFPTTAIFSIYINSNINSRTPTSIAIVMSRSILKTSKSTPSFRTDRRVRF